MIACQARRSYRETYFSTKCPKKIPTAWFPSAHVFARRTRCRPEAAAAWTGPAVRLIGDGTLIERVTDRGSFVALRRPTRRLRRGVLRLSYLDDGSGRIRVAYALSRRVGTAVVRNRIRRRLRSVFTEIDTTPDRIFPAGTYLVSASADAAVVPYEDLMDTAKQLLNELHGHGAYG